MKAEIEMTPTNLLQVSEVVISNPEEGVGSSLSLPDPLIVDRVESEVPGLSSLDVEEVMPHLEVLELEVQFCHTL